MQTKDTDNLSQPSISTDMVRRMTSDVAEVKRVLKMKSKNELIHSILNLMHNQLALIDAVQAMQAQLSAPSIASGEKEENKEEPTHA